jgi:ribonuclease-3
LIQSLIDPETALQALAERLQFRDQARLRQALTHRSYLNENPGFTQDNERLEFLGDAILDFIVGAWLYEHYPEKSEGDMTRIRSALVRTERLAAFARQVHLGDALFLGRGEENNGGRDRDGLLCGAFEALLGALYLDRGLEAVRHFVQPFLESHIEEVLFQLERIDPKSHLQNWAQGQHIGTPKYEIVKAEGPDHRKRFTAEVTINGEVYGRGQGHSKHQAEENAALNALDQLGVL